MFVATESGGDGGGSSCVTLRNTFFFLLSQFRILFFVVGMLEYRNTNVSETSTSKKLFPLVAPEIDFTLMVNKNTTQHRLLLRSARHNDSFTHDTNTYTHSHKRHSISHSFQ